MRRMIRCVWIVLMLLFGGHKTRADSGYEQSRWECDDAFTLDEIELDSLDVSRLPVDGQRALQMKKLRWKQARTAHFVLHYENEKDARRLGRMAEFMYGYIADELQLTQDLYPARPSHLFIFSTHRQWRAFLRELRGVPEWTGSYVRGPDLYLQCSGRSFETSARLAHEMSHLIMYRFFGAAPPLWLSEGLAQWYETFGYAAFKGVKKGKRRSFRAKRKWYPLEALLAQQGYPDDPVAVEQFYNTSLYLTGFLLLDYPSEYMVELTRRLVAGEDIWQVMTGVYGIAAPEYLQRRFDLFVP